MAVTGTSPPGTATTSEPVSIFAPGLRSASVGATALIALFALEYIAVAAAMPTVAAALDGYALYNLGASLNRSGDPDAAIPILERRLERFGDNAAKDVKRELKAARRDAGK